MHVLILPSWYFAPGTDDIGGRNFHQLAKALREENIDAHILFAHFSPYASFRKKTGYLVEDSVPTWRTSQWFPPKKITFLLSRWIKKYVAEVVQCIQKEGRPDLLHAHSYSTAIVAMEIKKELNIPFVYTEHLSRFINNRIPGIYKKYIASLCDNADLITCVSPGLASRLKAYTKKAIEVVPNFYDPQVFHFNPNVEKNKLFTWVAIGEPSHTKGLDLIIKAFGKVSEKRPDELTQLILIDDIKDRKELVQLAKIHQVDAQILWTGLIHQEKIAEILQKSHVLISASRVETFGTVMVEAQACGLPVIATTTDGASFIMQSPEQGKLIELNNVDELAAAMTEMYTSYPQYRGMEISEYVRHRFSKNIVIEQWIDHYHKIIA